MDYCAFVLASGDPDSLRLVELGPASRVDDLIGKLRTRIVATARSPLGRLQRPTFEDEGLELGRTLINPLLRFLGDSRQIFVSPDGMLNALPFEILPLDDNRLMLDRFEIGYLASGRDLLRFGKRAGPPARLSSSLTRISIWRRPVRPPHGKRMRMRRGSSASRARGKKACRWRPCSG